MVNQYEAYETAFMEGKDSILCNESYLNPYKEGTIYYEGWKNGYYGEGFEPNIKLKRNSNWILNLFHILLK